MTAALAFAAGVFLAWLCLRTDTPTAPATTAPVGYRRRGVPVLPPAALPAGPIALGQTTGPTTAELHLWLVATNGMEATVTGQPRHTGEADTCLLDAA